MFFFYYDEDIFKIAMDYFKNIYASQGVADPSDILDRIESYVSLEMNRSLLADFTAEEVLVAIRLMGPLKASSEDGLGVVFYQRF
ncbi:hypothetical protein HRI_003827800 [Hibiscus trionum]|uniref:Uncharacterized protein n=1 Tax=Hibiscus trionum TaxID=183268 RepID=A0A9W7ML70_HIBTR|nr:hypothetical protein HRI_003827800 [Hibiscus trionum]